MPMSLKSILAVSLLATTCFSQAFAAGMVPETTLVVIDESTHSGVINVKILTMLRRCFTPPFSIYRMTAA